MDRIHIEALKLRCIIGINDWERKSPQDVLVDLTLHTDTRRAGASDNIADTVNYRTLAKSVIAHVEQSQYYLVEALAENIARLCLQTPGVQRAEVGVRKPGALRFAESVGVSITRDRGTNDVVRDIPEK